jgi:DNA repair protein RecN (Recombination protein N)
MTISADGGSKAFINETPVTLKLLGEVTQPLINICDQNENRHLTEASNQTQFLDDFAGQTKTANLVERLYLDWRHAEKILSQEKDKNSAQSDRTELLNYQLGELKGLSLSENEFEHIENEHRRRSNTKYKSQRYQRIHNASH